MRRVRKTPPTTYDANYGWRFRYGLGREIFQDTLRSSSTVVDSTEWIYLAGESVGAAREVTGATAALHRMHTDRQGVPRKASNTSSTIVRTVPMSVTAPFGRVDRCHLPRARCVVPLGLI